MTEADLKRYEALADECQDDEDRTAAAAIRALITECKRLGAIIDHAHEIMRQRGISQPSNLSPAELLPVSGCSDRGFHEWMYLPVKKMMRCVRCGEAMFVGSP